MPCCAVLLSFTNVNGAGDWQAHQAARLHRDGLLCHIGRAIPEGNVTGASLLLVLHTQTFPFLCACVLVRKGKARMCMTAALHLGSQGAQSDCSCGKFLTFHGLSAGAGI